MNDAGAAAFRQIIVVDDEPGLREMVGEYLSNHGFIVRAAESGVALDALLAERPADLVLLDVNLGAEDGFAIARRLRTSRPTLPIVMLTAMGEVVDRVVGLELGADDYITKPFDLRELRARVKSVLRRMQARAPGAPAAVDAKGRSPRVRVGTCALDLGSHQLFAADGGEVPLTAMEFDLLKAFVERPRRVLSRDQLLALTRNREWEPFDRSIDIRIARVRRKIEADPAHPQAIRTVRGTGYMFVPSESAA
jgi:two-component system, OmpR family, response regulator